MNANGVLFLSSLTSLSGKVGPPPCLRACHAVSPGSLLRPQVGKHLREAHACPALEGAVCTLMLYTPTSTQ